MEYAEEGFADLEDKLFDQYIELKVDPILGELEERMYEGRFEWSSCKEPLSVRDYVKDSITQIVEVCQQDTIIIVVFCCFFCILFICICVIRTTAMT